MKALAHICQMIFPNYITDGDHISDERIYDIIQNMSITSEDLFSYSLWQTNYDYSWLPFTPLLTEEGICFAFNDLNSHEIYSNQ